MTKSPVHDDRLKAIRGDPPAAGGPLAALLVGQTWLWRRSGLVVGLLLAMLIASLTLTPMPDGRLVTSGLDKVYHFIAFAGLIFPLILTDSRRWFWAVPACILYGGLIELIQPSVGRSAEWLDFGADLTGVLAGAALAEILHDRIRDRFFAVEAPMRGDEDESAESRRMEAVRAELMDELRVVLREELSGLRSESPHPSDTESASPVPSDRPSPPPARPAPGIRH
ncbi:MAG: VanZ family protein [Rhodobacteraceae bacterium]|nr:VanZ family protein [Paracoccaceae bacterium]